MSQSTTFPWHLGDVPDVALDVCLQIPERKNGMFSSLAPLLSVRAPLCVPERRWWGGTAM